MAGDESWSSLELRHLRMLAELARTGSFTRTAEMLGYSQSAVSQQLAQLERIVGLQLVVRESRTRPTALTNAGCRLVRHAEAIIGEMASARTELADGASGSSPKMRIGTFQSLSCRILPGAARAVQLNFPDIDMDLTEADDDGELLVGVERGEIDVAFAVLPLPRGPLDGRELLLDPYVLVVREDSELATRAFIGAAELRPIPILTYGELRAGNEIDYRLGQPGFLERVMFRSNDNMTLMHLVAEGLGSAVVPWLSFDPWYGPLRAVRICDVNPRRLSLVRHRHRTPTPAVQMFIDAAHNVGQRLQQQIDAGFSGSTE